MFVKLHAEVQKLPSEVYLPEAIDAIREYRPEIFVGRNPEILKVETLVANLKGQIGGTQQRGADWHCGFNVGGGVGIGKSWLLQHLAETAITADRRSLEMGNQLGKTLGVHSFYVDLGDAKNYQRGEEDSERLFVRQLLIEISHQVATWADVVPTGILGVGQNAPLEDISRWIEADLRRYTNKQPLVLTVDHIDKCDWKVLKLLDGEGGLLGSFASLPHTAILLAGKGGRYPWVSPELRLHMGEIELKSFDIVATQEQLTKQYGSDFRGAEEIDAQSNGNPLANSAFARFGIRNGRDALVRAILESTASEIDTGKLCELLEALCVLRAFDEDRIFPLLATYYNEPNYLYMTFQEAIPVRKLLVRSGFATWDNQKSGWVVDELVKNTFMGELKERSPEVFKRLHETAYQMYSGWAEQYPEAQILWGTEAEYHKLQLGGDFDAG